MLCETSYSYQEDDGYRLKFSTNGNVLSFFVNGEKILETTDDTYAEGAAGFVISGGTMTCDSLIINSLEEKV